MMVMSSVTSIIQLSHMWAGISLFRIWKEWVFVQIDLSAAYARKNDHT
jgi:hypothetical protein